jgi:hypothetical protein
MALPVLNNINFVNLSQNRENTTNNEGDILAFIHDTIITYKLRTRNAILIYARHNIRDYDLIKY